MRSLFIICVTVSTVFGCTKKAAPTTTVDSKAATETKAVTEIKPTAVTPVESSMSMAGHVTFDAKCGRCHSLKKPGDYTVEQWMPILSDMAIRARLDSTERANVRAYISFYARPAN